LHVSDGVKKAVWRCGRIRLWCYDEQQDTRERQRTMPRFGIRRRAGSHKPERSTAVSLLCLTGVFAAGRYRSALSHQYCRPQDCLGYGSWSSAFHGQKCVNRIVPGLGRRNFPRPCLSPFAPPSTGQNPCISGVCRILAGESRLNAAKFRHLTNSTFSASMVGLS